jgi:hypothetical protein
MPTHSFRASVPTKSQSRASGENVCPICFVVQNVNDEVEAGAEDEPASRRAIAAIIENGRVRISLVVLVLVVSGFPAQLSYEGERRGSNHVAPTANNAPALDGSILGGINASGFLFTSHAFEVIRIGGIRLLRAQSASCIVHCMRPWFVPPTSHQRLEPTLTLEDNLLTYDDDLHGSTRRLAARPMGSHHWLTAPIV